MFDDDDDDDFVDPIQVKAKQSTPILHPTTSNVRSDQDRLAFDDDDDDDFVDPIQVKPKQSTPILRPTTSNVRSDQERLAYLKRRQEERKLLVKPEASLRENSVLVQINHSILGRIQKIFSYQVLRSKMCTTG